MGSGSELAREAADIILLDSNFASIVVGIRNGRLVYDNLKKVLIYLLPAGTFAELMTVLATIFIGLPGALSGFQMIVISCVTDVFCAMSLIYEHAEADLMLREPRSITGERLVNPQLFLHAYLFTGIFNALCAFGMFFYYMSSEAGIPIGDLVFAFDKFADGFHGYSQDELNEILWTGQTVYFVTLVISNFGNLLSVRRGDYPSSSITRCVRRLAT